MLAVMSAVAFAGYLFRPMGDSYRASSVSLSVPSVATEHPNEFREVPTLGYTGIPNFGARGGYGEGEPGYVAAPTHALGRARDTDQFAFHVRPPVEDENGVRYAPGGAPYPAGYTDKIMPSDGTYRGIVGPQVTMERGAVTREEVTGPVRPDRLFEGEKMRAFNGERERDARLAPDILNRRYELPENRLRVNRPNPQQAHVDSGALPITTYGRVQTHLRAGTRNRAPIPDFETGNRMRSDAGTWTTSVLPERAAVLSTRENVSDAMDKGTPATWARMQVTGNRVNPKRLDHLNALEAHPAPVGDGGLEAIQFGARTGAKVREPLGVKTCVQRVPNSEFVTSVDRVEDQEHTHLFENRTFDAVMPGGEYPQTRDAVEDAFQIGRFPLLDRSQLTAVAVGAPDMAQYNEERKERGSRDGERVMRMKQGDVSYDIDRETIARVYDPLEENPYFIPCVQVEGESFQ
eukprot:jgi/Mesvir1/6391/Mv06724-RA.1